MGYDASIAGESRVHTGLKHCIKRYPSGPFTCDSTTVADASDSFDVAVETIMIVSTEDIYWGETAAIAQAAADGGVSGRQFLPGNVMMTLPCDSTQQIHAVKRTSNALVHVTGLKEVEV